MTTSPTLRTRRQNFFLIVTLGILNALTPFSIDMYLPSFPQIAGDLGVPVAQMALTVSFYFIGYALGQVFYGPLLDRFGRKKPLYFGLGLYILASLGCMNATSLNELMFYRLLSALGGCSASVGTMAMVRDFFPAEASARVFSMLMLVLSASPLLAPGIGSLVVTWTGWRAIFAILAVMGLVDLLLVKFALPHGYEPDRSVRLRAGPVLSSFKEILKNPTFSTYVFAGSFSFAGLFVYIAGSPAIFMEGFGVSPQGYGLIFAILAVGMIGGGQLNMLLMKFADERKIFRTALLLQVACSMLFLIGTLAGGLGVVSTVAVMFGILACAGVTYPNAVALGLSSFTRNVGSASALLGFLQLGIGALVSAGVGFLDVRGSLPTALAIAISSTLGLLIVLVSRPGVSSEK